MDSERFDNLTRTLSGLPSRREVFRLLAGAVGAVAAAAGPAPAGWRTVAARKKGKRKKGKQQRGNEEPASNCKSELAACTSDDFCSRKGLYVCVGGRCIEDADDRWWLETCADGCQDWEGCHGEFCRWGCQPGNPLHCSGECVPKGYSGYCIECIEDAHCGNDRFCVDNFCTQCRTDEQCPVSGEANRDWVRPGSPQVCRANNCRPSCESDADCETAYDVDIPSAKPLARSCVNGACVWDLHKEGCAYGFQGGGGA